jgi:hypothetical protein
MWLRLREGIGCGSGSDLQYRTYIALNSKIYKVHFDAAKNPARIKKMLRLQLNINN